MIGSCLGVSVASGVYLGGCRRGPATAPRAGLSVRVVALREHPEADDGQLCSRASRGDSLEVFPKGESRWLRRLDRLTQFRSRKRAGRLYSATEDRRSISIIPGGSLRADPQQARRGADGEEVAYSDIVKATTSAAEST